MALLENQVGDNEQGEELQWGEEVFSLFPTEAEKLWPVKTFSRSFHCERTASDLPHFIKPASPIFYVHNIYGRFSHFHSLHESFLITSTYAETAI